MKLLLSLLQEKKVRLRNSNYKILSAIIHFSVEKNGLIFLQKRGYACVVILFIFLSEFSATSFSPTWMQLSLLSLPPPRLGASMAFDPATEQLVLFGGVHKKDGLLSDTWNWSGNHWAQLFPQSSPPARNFASMTFDFATGQLLLFGGNDNSGFLADTWNWTMDFPLAIASPCNQTISSGSSTFIHLSSNMVGSTFNWTVSENGVTGASNGSGALIVQTLTITSNVNGTAIYTITPTSPDGCIGAPIVVVVNVVPLSNL